MKLWLSALLGALGILALSSRMRLQYRADHDAFTGLYHKTAFFRRAERRSHGRDGRGLLIIDVDDFKSVNDSRGHAAGDAVLQQIAACLRSSFRRGDLVGRFGGDEFLVLLLGIHSAEALEERIPEIQSNLRSTLKDVTVSIGAAWSETEDSRTLFLRADKALYAAKAKGKDTYAMG